MLDRVGAWQKNRQEKRFRRALGVNNARLCPKARPPNFADRRCYAKSVSDDEILSVAGYFRHEGEKVKGSRFIVTLDHCPVFTAFEALLAQLRAEFPDATHHCYGWRGEEEPQFRCSDDGEPYGSAGIPILKAIQGRSLFSTGVIVTRYFGGTKLGVGGLVRAYGGSAGQALDLAPRSKRRIVAAFDLRFDYGFSGAVESVLHAFSAQTTDSDYTEQVQCTVQIARNAAEAFETAIKDACRGQVWIQGSEKKSAVT